MKFTNMMKYSAVALMATVGLFGCSSNTTEQEQIKVVTNAGEGVNIQFWHNMSGAFTETINEIVDNFNNTIGLEKGIEVEAIYQGSYDDLKAKTVAAIKAGETPNIVQGTVNNIMELTQSGYVQDLGEYINHDEIGIKDYEDVFEVYRNEMSSYTQTGEIYSLPFAKSTDLLFYNKTFFDENDLSVPATWEELISVSKKIFELTGKPGFSVDNLPNYLITYLFQAGADYTSKDGKILYNNETSVEAIKMLQEGINEGYFRLAGEDKYSSAPFLSENTYMYVGSSAGEGYLNMDNFEWDTALVPQINPENPINIQQGANISVLNQNNTSEEVYASYEFVKYMISQEVNTEWAMSTGYLPIRQSVANSEEFVNYLENTKGNVKANGIAATANSFVESVFNTGDYNSAMIRNDLNAMLEDILLNGQDVHEALDYYSNRY